MQFAFYLFCILIAVSASAAVLSRNPVHSILHLILSFLSTGALFISVNAEFIAMVLVIVYVGAIAVLFLFIAMMIPQQEEAKHIGISITLISALSLCGFLAFWLINSWEQMPRNLMFRYPVTIYDLGRVLYTDYIYIFQLAGVILLLAMISSISLALHKTKKIKRQNLSKQLLRSSNAELIDVKSGEGVNI